MFSNNTIKKRVLSAINTRLNEMQKSYNETCTALTTKCKEDKVVLDQKLNGDKESMADKLVDSIVGKLL